MKIQRERLNTQLDPVVLNELTTFAKNSNLKTTNKVIEALVRNFLKYLDVNGNVILEFYKNRISDEALQLIVEKFSAFLNEERRRGRI